MEIYGVDLDGIEGQLVKFSVVKAQDSSGVALLGNAGKVVREGSARAMHAISTFDGNWNIFDNSGYTLDLTPAGTPKTSEGLDLPIAIMLLQASIRQNLDLLDNDITEIQQKAKSSSKNEPKRQAILHNLKSLVEQKERALKYQKRLAENKSKYILIGKLDISDGSLVSPQYGMFGLIAAASRGHVLIVPEKSEIHAALVKNATQGLKAYKAQNLQEVWDIVLGKCKPRDVVYDVKKIRPKETSNSYTPDLKAVKGVNRAKWAMLVALAGGHNILLVGPPGGGKTMLSKAALNLLPDLSREDMFKLNQIYSAKGELREDEILLSRPFRQATSNSTSGALYGGVVGRITVPGLVSLAHLGILFFDEINLCPSTLIEHLRVLLDEGVMRIQRVTRNVEYPSNFILAAAMNPCKCGYYLHFRCPACGDIFFGESKSCAKHPKHRLVPHCSCNSRTIDAYFHKLSKPLLDRIDLKVFVSFYDDGEADALTSATSTLKARVQAARESQARRFKDKSYIRCNADIPDRSQFETLSHDLNNYVSGIYRRMRLTKREEDKLLNVSRTIADLEGRRDISRKNVDFAVEMMGLNHEFFRKMTG